MNKFDPKTYKELQSHAGPIHRQVIEMLKDQLLIAFLKRLGGEIKMPVSEVDATGGFNLALSLDPSTAIFTFKAERKQ